MTKETADAKLQGYLALACRRRLDDGSVATCVRRMTILVDPHLLMIETTYILYLTSVCSTSDVYVLCMLRKVNCKKLTRHANDGDDA